MLNETCKLFGCVHTICTDISAHMIYCLNFLQVRRRIGLFDPQGYATIVWSFGKLGPQAKQISLGPDSFEQMMEGLLEAARQDLSRFNLNDSLNIVLGLAGLQLSQNTSGGLLRGLSKILHHKVHQLPPNDLVALLWALGKLEDMSNGDLVTKMCQAVEQNFKLFDIAALCTFLRGLVAVSHQGTIALVTKAQHTMEQKIDDLDLNALSKGVWALLPLSVHPGSVLMGHLGDLLSSAPENLSPAVVTRTMVALTHKEVPHAAAVETAKAHFIENASQYTASDVTSLLWCLSMMDALDADVFDAAKAVQFKGLTPSQLSFENKRQLCQVLISWRILHGQSSPDFMSFELEEACYDAWKATQRVRTTFGLVSEVMQILKSMDFTCRSPLLLDKIPMSVTSAVRGGQPGEDDLKLVVEVGSRMHVYRNRLTLLKPRQRWRNQILHSVGWTVIRVPVTTWNGLPSHEARVTLLKKLIESKSSAKSPDDMNKAVADSKLEPGDKSHSDHTSKRAGGPQVEKQDAMEGAGDEDDEALPIQSENIEKELEDMGIDMMGSRVSGEEVPNVKY